MKIMGRTQPLAKYTILDCLNVIKKLGFDGVEICLENPDLAPANITDAVVHHVRAVVSELGLAPHSVSYHKDYIYDDSEFELTKRAIRLTPEFGASIFVFAGTLKRTGDAAEWKRTVERTRELVNVAADSGVILALEFEPGFIVGSTLELLRLFSDLPSAHLAANLDVGHAFLCDADPMVSIQQLGKKIVHCHVENMKTGVHDHVLPWEGDMALDTYMMALQRVGYTGGLALDLYKHDYEAVATKSINYLRQAMPGGQVQA